MAAAHKAVNAKRSEPGGEAVSEGAFGAVVLLCIGKREAAPQPSAGSGPLLG